MAGGPGNAIAPPSAGQSLAFFLSLHPILLSDLPPSFFLPPAEPDASPPALLDLCPGDHSQGRHLWLLPAQQVSKVICFLLPGTGV